MRILHLASSHRWTGVAEPASALAEEQTRLGHEVHFACVKGHSFARRLGRRDLIAVGDLHLEPGIHLIEMTRDIMRLRALIADKKFDVVHCHLNHDHWIAAITLSGLTLSQQDRPARPILVRTLHRDAPPRSDPVSRRLFAEATDVLIAVSQSGRREAAEALRIAEDRVVWVRGAVDLDRFKAGGDRHGMRKQWKIPGSAPVAGIVARMQPHRGHHLFLDAVDDVLARVPEARFVLVGRGELKKELRARRKAHPRARQIIEAGYHKETLADCYSAFDVSVLLAQGSDGTCRAMLESMACTRAVIGVERGAIADTITPGRTGWLVGSEPTREALAGALIEALSDRERTMKMGRAARAEMEENFTQQCRAQSVMAVYENALALREVAAEE